MATPAEIHTALRYGWGLLYSLKIEGCDVLTVERSVSSAPTGYTLDASLVIDNGSKIGSVVDRKKGIGKSFDLSIQLLDTTAVRAMFKKPTKVARLTSSLAHATTGSMSIETTETSWASPCYLGNERIEFASTTGSPITVFNTLTRGTPATDWRAYDHDLGSMVATYVTDSPQWWRGRRVVLYATPVDPVGGVHGAHLHTDAIELFAGVINTDPRVNRDGLWEFNCRSLERRLTEPVAVELSGTCHFGMYDNAPVDVDPDAVLHFAIWTGTGTASITVPTYDISIRPYEGLTGQVSFAAARRLVADKFNAHGTVTGASDIGGLTWKSDWVQTDEGSVYNEWTAMVKVDSSASDSWWIILGKWEVGNPPPPWLALDWGFGYEFDNPQVATSSGSGRYIKTTLKASARTTSISYLTVKLTEGDPTALPSSGWVRLEANDQTVYLPYDQVTSDESQIRVRIDRDGGSVLGHQLGGEFLVSGISGDVDVTFIHRDDGRIQDTMRRMLMSSGRGTNSATFDTKPLSAGMDLARVDEGSFEENLDGIWNMLGGLNLRVDSGTTFATLYGGLIALGQRAIVSRYSTTGTVEIAAVRTGVGVTSAYAGEITDRDVAVVGGSSPIRPMSTIPAPNAIGLKIEGDPPGTYHSSDLPAMRAQGVRRWDLKAQGLNRNALTLPFYSWCNSHFASARSTQAVQVDVLPWTDFGGVGDLIRFETSHFSAWDLSAGEPGYDGPARVIGVQFDLKKHIYTVTLLINGTTEGGMTLCPAAPVLVAGYTGPNLLYVEIAGEYYDLFNAYQPAASTYYSTVYLPGGEAGGTLAITVSATALMGGGNTRLTCTAPTSPVITTDWRVTLPDTATSNADQSNHMHTDTDARWI